MNVKASICISETIMSPVCSTVVVIIKVAMMEICDWLEVRTSLKVVWSFVTVVCGARSVVISGAHQMPAWPAASWDSQLQVK